MPWHMTIVRLDGFFRKLFTFLRSCCTICQVALTPLNEFRHKEANMLREFMDFIRRGNVLDLAVAVILGVAFGAIVTSLVDDIIMPLIGLVIGGVDFSSLSIQVGDAVIAYGSFIQAIVNFLLISLALFMLVKAAKSVQRPPAE